MKAHALAPGIGLNQDQVFAALIAIEEVGVPAARAFRYRAVEQQHFRECLADCVDRGVQAAEVDAEHRALEQLARRRAHVQVFHLGKRFCERAESSTLVIVVEHHNLTPQLQVLSDNRHRRARFHRLQQEHATLVVKGAHHLVIDWAIDAVFRFVEEAKRVIELLTGGVVNQLEAAIIVERHIETAAEQRAGILQPLIEVLLHQLGIHTCFRLCELVVAHAVPEMLHVEAFPVIP